MPPALEAWSLNHWTTENVFCFLKNYYFLGFLKQHFKIWCDLNRESLWWQHHYIYYKERSVQARTGASVNSQLGLLKTLSAGPSGAWQLVHMVTRYLTKLLTHSPMHSKVFWGGDQHRGPPCSWVRLSPQRITDERPWKRFGLSDSHRGTEPEPKQWPHCKSDGAEGSRTRCAGTKSRRNSRKSSVRKEPASQDKIAEEYSS